MKTIAALLFIAVIIFSFSTFAHCQGASKTPVTKIREGEVAQIDTVGNTFVLRWMGWDDGIGYHEAVFSVSPDTKIMKGTGTIGFMDVNQFDRFVINYVDDHSPAPMVTSIIVDNNF